MKLPRTQIGFTLVELIVVLVLVGVLAVSLVPRFFSDDGVKEYLYRDQALNILRRVQMQSMQCSSCAPAAVNVIAKQLYVGSASCQNDATHLCISSRDSAMTLIPINFNQSIKFDSSGKPLDSCASGQCEIRVQGAVTLAICIESEGYIHPC
ncbi:prepilin-type N-terminal cleavage/methylation domain-containing protein [Rheinheimera sp. WS51]|uniref:prepilin-type N-terminal cleavage/methylation domain-containing protein n=1 Tax=Rheinheimera sp. WS51 TaxID=3425886 RepID=UPI003D8DBDBB